MGFDATDWNPNRKLADDQAAGRFDPLPPSPGSGAGFLYGSQSGAGEKVAIVETFRSLMARDPALNGRNMISRAERNRRAIRLFELPDPVVLVNLNSQAGRECFRMDEEVLYVHDRPATRSWSDAIKEFVPEAAGLAYNSTREGSDCGLHSFILWEDRMRTPRFRMIREISLSSPEGRELVDEALDAYNVLWI